MAETPKKITDAEEPVDKKEPFVIWSGGDNENKYLESWIASSDSIDEGRFGSSTRIAQEIQEIDEEKRAKQLENDSKQQDIKLKKETLNRLFILLCTETIVVFIFAYWQGRENNKFTIDPWSFRLIIAATILQITTMLIYAVRHLFPNPPDKPK